MEEMSDKEKGEEIQQWQLPDDVITKQILPWLPIKPLTRCKVISKNWYSAISSPNFILKHTKQPLISHSVPPVETLLIQSGNNFYLYSCDHDDNVARNHTYNEEKNLIKLNNNGGDLFDVGSDTIYLVGSSNGLVCLGEKIRGKYFILWNPSTNQCQKYYPEYAGDFPPAVSWGFGYTSSLDDYNVVRIFLEGGDNFFRYCVVHVYSLRTNTYKRMELDPIHCCVDQPRLVNDTIYWIAVGSKIVAYDLVRETFVAYPHLDMQCSRSDFLCVMGGCLTMYTRNSEDDFVLNIFESSGRVVSVPCVLCRRDFTNLSGLTKTGKIFVARRRPAMLGLFDPGQSSNQSLIDFQSHIRIYIASCVSRRVSPLPPAELPVASGQVA